METSDSPSPALPAGATASLNPVQIAGSGVTVLTVITIAATPAGTYPLSITAANGALSRSVAASLVVTAPFSPIRINAGGAAYSDTAGHPWSADAGYQQGSSWTNGATIAGTVDSPLYNTLRYSTSGLLVYQFAVPNGTYSVNLKFAELYFTTTGARVFDVAVNGTTIRTSLDMVAAAGGRNIALDVGTTVVVGAGQITITLTRVVGDPQINGIEITTAGPDFSVSSAPGAKSVVPGGSAAYTVTAASAGGFNGTMNFTVSGLPAGATASFNPASITGSGPATLTVNTIAATPLGNFPVLITATSGSLSHTSTVTLVVAPAFAPIRINAGGGVFTDSVGHVWAADAGFQQGAAWTNGANIAGTPDTLLYNTLRYSPTGLLVYQFAVPDGTYSVNLKFAELYYTTPGHRVFNVAINGSVVRANLDIAAAAGGGNIALDVGQTVTVSGGQITISLTGVTGDPQVNAIEIYQ